MSAARTAKPSIDELGNGGRSTERDGGLGEDPPGGLRQRHALGGQRLGPRQDRRERLVDGQERGHDAPRYLRPRGTLAA